jgi:hypothetical protein
MVAELTQNGGRRERREHMGLRLLVVTILAALSLPAADPVTLGLVVRRGVAVPAPVRSYFESETEQAVRQSLKAQDLNLVWRDEGALPASESFDRLIVVGFQGDCSTMMPKSPVPAGPLGWTSTVEGRVLPFIQIDCGRVKAVLAESGNWSQALIPAGILARAMSRVAVHEIYHVLSERKHHDAEGLFKAAYTSADLLAPALPSQRAHTEIADVSGRR